MASANSSTECSSGNGSNSAAAAAATVPQWKRDLIQRRRQQNKVSTSNGASVKSCSALSSTSTSGVPCVDLSSSEPAERLSSCRIEDNLGVSASCVSTSRSRTSESTGSCAEYSTTAIATTAIRLAGSPCKLARQASCGATCNRDASGSPALPSSGGERANESQSSAPHEAGGGSGVSSVARNMRLEADVSSFLPVSEDATGFNGNNLSRNNHPIVIDSIFGRDSIDYDNYDNNDDDAMRNYGNNVVVKNKRSGNNREQDCDSGGGIATRIIRRMDDRTNVCIYPNEQTRKTRTRMDATCVQSANGKIHTDECESDSSEELQYGPGIVNRLKSKYLNLTLREMDKSRVTVQRFRRAASLEDLLDCDDEQQCEKTSRKYAKRATAGVASKTDRYRTATRGNESMKRARSVETLMRYNSPSGGTDDMPPSSRFSTLRQESVNDHIVLIDRTSIKIESRLVLEPDRPKAVNKPKRIKPLLAETERPPTDLVKTTMRLFEGSVKKFKPKGEVAVKVATFKTINDTYKAQAMKKVIPKPPVQPKPFVNGNAKVPTSPKKLPLGAKPTAEVIESPDNEEHRREGVITEPIVQSVSSVVSKFRQIEKSYTPSASPEPPYKLKFSPSPSPEPSIATRLSRSSENLVKSPPITPVSSPRITSPASPKREDAKQTTMTTTTTTTTTSPGRESSRQISSPEVDRWQKLDRSEENERNRSSVAVQEDTRQNVEAIENDSNTCANDDDEDNSDAISSKLEDIECVDGSRTITKMALDNISKAGLTMQYNFDEKSSIGKTYLPGSVPVTENGEKPDIVKTTNGDDATKVDEKIAAASPLPMLDASSCSSPMSIDSINDDSPLTNDSVEKTASPVLTTTKHAQEYAKPLGAISSLAVVKSSSPASASSRKPDASPPQKQIGIIRPLVSTKSQQQTQQSLSNRELEKNLINRVKSIEQPTKVVVSLKSADEIQPVKKTTESSVGGGGGGGLWDTKHWNQANNTMVFNFSNRKDVPDYIENDGLIIRRKREKQKAGDRGVIVLDATLDASTTDDSDWEISGGPPSPCDVTFTNDNVLINGRSNLSKQPRNHKHRIQFDDGATKTFEYPSEASMLEEEGTSVDGDASPGGCQQSSQGANKTNSSSSSSTMSSALLGGGGLASFTPSKIDLASEGFELGVTRAAAPTSAPIATNEQTSVTKGGDEEYLKSDEDAAAWGAEATADLLY